MVWYNFYNFYFYSLRKINKKGNFILFNQNFSLKVFKWIHKQFYVHLLSWKISPQLKKSMNLNHFRNQQIEFFCFKRLINNFSSNGKFLKYYNIFIKIFSKLYLLFFLNQFKLQLKHHQLNNLLNILTNLKTNILLLLPSYLIFFIFSQYDILSRFIAKWKNLLLRTATPFLSRSLFSPTLSHTFLSPSAVFPSHIFRRRQTRQIAVSHP